MVLPLFSIKMGKKSQGKQRYLVQAVSPEGVKLGSCTTACFKERKLLLFICKDVGRGKFTTASVSRPVRAFAYPLRSASGIYHYHRIPRPRPTASASDLPLPIFGCPMLFMIYSLALFFIVKK